MKEGYTFDENKIRKYMMKNIASYKIPKRFIPMDALPKKCHRQDPETRPPRQLRKAPPTHGGAFCLQLVTGDQG